MTGAFDVAEALDGGISDQKRVWAFIRGFAAAWGEPLTEGDGTPAAELARVEATLGCSLPAALREVYTLLGARFDLIGNQDPLLPPAEMFVHDECGGVLVFRSENQGCAFWSVRLRDLDQDDPPVFVQARHGWVQFLDRVSLACVELVLSEALLGGGGRLYNACELPVDLLGALPERFQRSPCPTTRCGRVRRTFRCDGSPPRGQLLRQDGLGVHSWLHVRGRTRADPEAICATVPGRWVLGYTETLDAEPLPF